MNWGKVLVVVAHADDEVLGAGGAISRHAKGGENITCLVLGDGVSSRVYNDKVEVARAQQRRQKHAQEAAKALGISHMQMHDFPDNQFDTVPQLDIIKAVEDSIMRVHPDTILTHHPGDLNIDHQIAYRAVITASRPLQGQCVRRILSFEVPSSTEWSFGTTSIPFRPNVFVDVSRTIEDKLRAMEIYEDEARDFPHPRSRQALTAIARRWGSVAGYQSAEAFELVRELV